MSAKLKKYGGSSIMSTLGEAKKTGLALHRKKEPSFLRKGAFGLGKGFTCHPKKGKGVQRTCKAARDR